MKFKTRLRLTLIIIIVLPMILTSLAFCTIGVFLMYAKKGMPVAPFDYAEAYENMQQMVGSLISGPLLTDMFIAILLILIFTGVMLTRWINDGVIKPVNELNTAMRKIKEGNFEYALQTDVKGEIGDLYRNYEDMRLRLKESTEESTESEKRTGSSSAIFPMT